jgi:flagellar biosynthetic protein FliQ
MTLDQAVDLVRQSLMLMLMLAAPVLLAAVVIGLIISVFQTVTQLQEQTLTFVPKILGMGVVAILVAPWLAIKILEFSERMFRGG